MKLFKRRSRKNFKEATAKQNSIKNIMAKAAGLIKGSDRGDLESPEYDLEEIKAASESDSYIRVTYLKYSYLLFKAGHRFKSDNENALQYIKTRLYLMGYSTNKPIDILFQEIGDDLVRYSNAFLVKSRADQVMTGVNAKPAFDAKGVVAGYFRIDPSTMQVDRDKFGVVKKWTQSVDGEEKSYKPEEIIHFYLDKDAANAFGTPRIVAALEDVKLLRSLEGNIATMIYRFAMPLYHWIIGLPKTGFQATNKEIDEAEETIDKLAADGSIITNEKTTIKVVGAEGAAISAEGYLKYFEQRVLAALSTSESQMGRGGAKQDADSMEAQAHDIVKHVQKTMSIFVQHFIINELLLEGGFNPILNEEDRVEMLFNEINLETKIKIENHEVYKFQSNVSTHEEARRNIGMSDTVDENRLHDQMIKVEAEKGIAKVRADETIRIAKENALLAPDTTGTEASGKKGINPKGNGNTGDNGADKGAENVQNPKNQHGTSSIKIKERSLNKKAHKKKFDDIYKKYYETRNDINREQDNIDSVLNLGVTSITSKIMDEINISFTNGVIDSSNDVKKNKNLFYSMPVVNMNTTSYRSRVESAVKKVFDDINKRIKKGEDIAEAFERVEYRIRFIIEYELSKSYWSGYALSASELGVKKLYVHFKDSKDKENHSEIINLKNLKLDNIPPFHPFCDCRLSLEKEEAKE